MCHIHGCNKEVENDDNSYYTCSDGHSSEELPAVVYRVNLVMKSSEKSDTTRHKVHLFSMSNPHSTSVVAF